MSPCQRVHVTVVLITMNEYRRVQKEVLSDGQASIQPVTIFQLWWAERVQRQWRRPGRL
jgi:hypothetical protein